MKSKLAITSFVLGLVPLIIYSILLLFRSFLSYPLNFFFMLTLIFSISSLVGLILGIISLFVIRQNKIEGTWFAILGILFSILGGLIWGLFLLLYIVGLH